MRAVSKNSSLVEAAIAAAQPSLVVSKPLGDIRSKSKREKSHAPDVDRPFPRTKDVASLLVEVLPDGLEVLPERLRGLDVGVDAIYVKKAAVAVPDDGAEPD